MFKLIPAILALALLAGCPQFTADVCGKVAAIEANPMAMHDLSQIDPHSTTGVLWANLAAGCRGGVPAPGVNPVWLAGVMGQFLATTQWGSPMSDSGFGKVVADVYREMKRQFETRPIADRTDGKTPTIGSVDREVREQVIADLDGLAKKHDPKGVMFDLKPELLGKEFEKVLYDNVWDLYVRS